MRGTQLAPDADKRNQTAKWVGCPKYAPSEYVVHVAVYKIPNGHNY
jgi:hypothetical protein